MSVNHTPVPAARLGPCATVDASCSTATVSKGNHAERPHDDRRHRERGGRVDPDRVEGAERPHRRLGGDPRPRRGGAGAARLPQARRHPGLGPRRPAARPGVPRRRQPVGAGDHQGRRAGLRPRAGRCRAVRARGLAPPAAGVDRRRHGPPAARRPARAVRARRQAAAPARVAEHPVRRRRHPGRAARRRADGGLQQLERRPVRHPAPARPRAPPDRSDLRPGRHAVLPRPRRRLPQRARRGRRAVGPRADPVGRVRRRERLPARARPARPPRPAHGRVRRVGLPGARRPARRPRARAARPRGPVRRRVRRPADQPVDRPGADHRAPAAAGDGVHGDPDAADARRGRAAAVDAGGAGDGAGDPGVDGGACCGGSVVMGFGEALDALDGLDPHALVVARRGTVLARATWAPYDAEHAGLVYSVSKSVTAMAVLLLESEGRLSLSDPVDAHLDLPNPHGFTLRHLLTMSTGHSREQTSVMPADPAVLLTTPPQFPGRTRYASSSPATCTLGRVVPAVAGEQPTAYLRPRLLDPLGIGPRWWRFSGGVEQGFSGLHLTVDDQARLGAALAAGGVAPDGTRVLPAAVVDALATTFVPTAETGVEDHQGPEPDTAHDDWALGYGYGVWRSRHGYRMDGAYGQFTLVVPESGVVVAYQGSAMDAQRVLDVLWELVAAAASSPAGAAGAGARDAPGVAGAAGTLVGGVAERDSWAARDRYVASDAPALDVAGWTLDDAGPDAWRLTVAARDGQPGGVVDLRPDAWSRGSLALRPGDVASGAPSDPVPDGVVPVAARAERLPDGSVRAHLVATAS